MDCGQKWTLMENGRGRKWTFVDSGARDAEPAYAAYAGHLFCCPLSLSFPGLSQCEQQPVEAVGMDEHLLGLAAGFELQGW